MLVVHLVLLFFALLYQAICVDIITTIAGSSTGGSFGGDGGAATAASLNYPYGVVLDSSGIDTIIFLLGYVLCISIFNILIFSVLCRQCVHR